MVWWGHPRGAQTGLARDKEGQGGTRSPCWQQCTGRAGGQPGPPWLPWPRCYVAETLLTLSSGPTELLPPWQGRCLLDLACGVSAVNMALDTREKSPERAQEQQHPEGLYLLRKASTPARVPKEGMLWAQFYVAWQRVSGKVVPTSDFSGCA